ncbi:MAG TPA: hypothetical protein VGU73_02520, partial [Acidimicrobiia bacterium]|nr:hypothetical protein [Acidimicrobiia bacterium]
NLDAGTVAGGRSPSTPGLGPSLKALLVGLGQLMLGQVPQAVAIAAVAAGAILLAALWVSARPSQHVPSAVLTCLITGGALVVVATIASIISASDVDQRILAPTVPLFVLSALWLFVQSGSRAPSLQARPAIRKAFVLTVVGLVVVGLAGLAQAWRHGESGRGFAAPSVRDSPVVRAARAVPLDTTIVTDDGLPIAYWTGRTRLLDIADSFEAAPAKVDDVARAACAGAATYLGTQPSATSSFQARARGRLAFVRLAAGSGVTRYQLAVINRASCATYGIGHR